MSKLKIIFIIGLMVLIFSNLAFSEEDEKYEKVLDAMQTEMNRNLETLKMDPHNPPFYIDYMTEVYYLYNQIYVLGYKASTSEGTYGSLTARVKIGSYEDDEVSYTKDIYNFDFKNFEDDYKYLSVEGPSDLNSDMIRYKFWTLTDFKYKKAIDLYTKKKETESLDVKENRIKLPHFTQNPPYKIKDIQNFKRPNQEDVDKLLKVLSEEFGKYEEILTSSISYSIWEQKTFYINSEGSEAYYNNLWISIYCNASTIMDDGNQFSDSFEIHFINGQKWDEEKVKKRIKEFIKNFIHEYHNAVDLEMDYVGPAVFKGADAGYYFNKYLVNLLNADRRQFDRDKLIMFGRLNKKILPKGTKIVDDPTLSSFKGTNIANMKIDKEGVKPQKVIIVENGLFKNFLTTKVPIEKFPKSNGHCSYISEESYAGPTTLIISSTNAVSYNRLIQEMKRICKENGYDEAIVLEEGKAYLYHVNSGKKELLKNITYSSNQPLPALRKIKMLGNDPQFFKRSNYGGIITPSILVEEIEIKKTRKQNILKPILPAPK